MLRARWLGRVTYRDAHALQHALHRHGCGDHLLLLEHPSTYTLGVRSDPAHVLVPAEQLGGELVRADRGGDVTWHGPGQLVGYPILTVPGKRGGGMADTAAYVASLEEVVIRAVASLGLRDVGRLRGRPGVWVEPDGPTPRKVAALGVRLARGRSMHGFALNVASDLAAFERIVPCGIADHAVTSLATEGIAASLVEATAAVVAAARAVWGYQEVEDAASAGPAEGSATSARVQDRIRVQDRVRVRVSEAGLAPGLDIRTRKPPWMRARVHLGERYRSMDRLVRDFDLVTVCEEAGCPNRSECWDEGTATFMLNGDRCTRACGFCLVDTRRPTPVDGDEPGRVAEAVDRLGLDHAVLTAVARDDLPDGGAGAFAATVAAIRARRPATAVEVLIPDCQGDPTALETIFAARPDVVNHNLETVLRLQRVVRPRASYARSLAVLGRSVAAGLVTKSGLMVGLGETLEEVQVALADLAGVGVRIVTIGQYLRPSAAQLPVARWWTPAEFEALADYGRLVGIDHVESGPFARSSYRARLAAQSAEVGAAADVTR